MKKGYVTVYFTVALAICMSLLMVMFRGVRENALRMRIKETADISVVSSFGEYQKTLWEKYGLIFVDAGYGHRADSMILAEERHKDCMNKNFDELPDIPYFGRDLYKLRCDLSETSNVRFATDRGCMPLINQCSEYMKYRFGIEYVTGLYELASQCADLEFSATSLKEHLDSAISKLDSVKDEPKIKEWTDKLEGAILEDKKGASNLILSLLIKDPGEISGKKVRKEALVRKRELNKGNWTGQVPDPADSLLFKEYLMRKCGDRLETKPDTALAYEIEYLICGADSDSENLSLTALRILMLREAANYYAISNDPSKMEMIRAMAALVAFVLLSPDIAEPLAQIIVAAWAYVESVKDLRVLFSGGKVPLIKTDADFYTDVFGSFTDRDVSERGMDYRDYLRAFLLLKSDRELAEGFADLLELNVRIADNNDHFRLDFCFDAWAVTSFVTSEYGYDYVVKRIFDAEVDRRT